MMSDDRIITKIELSHQSLAKTVSDFGAIVNLNNNELIELKTIVKDFIKNTEQILDKHESEIENLKSSDIEVRSVFKSGKWVAGIASFIVIGLIGTITTLGSITYHSNLKSLEDRLTSQDVKYEKSLNEVMSYLKSLPKQ